MTLCLQFWYTKKLLVRNKEIVGVINHLEQFLYRFPQKQFCFIKIHHIALLSMF